MALNNNSLIISDSEGLSSEGLVLNASGHLSRQSSQQKPKPPAKAPTLEEWDNKMRGTNNQMALSNSWNDPSQWGNRGQQVQQQQPPQQQAPPPAQAQQQRVVTPQQMEMPKTQEELARYVQGVTANTLTQASHQYSLVQDKVAQMRSKFLESEEWRPWYPVAEREFNRAIQSGMDMDSAARAAIDQCQQLNKMGVRPDPQTVQRTGILLPTGQYADTGTHTGFRPDEGHMKQGMSFYSEEQRQQDREHSLRARREDQLYRKSHGQQGSSFKDAMARLSGQSS